MNFQNYESVSFQVKEQINDVIKIWKDHLEDSLVGIYIHGSLAMACFVEESSDIDLLVVSRRRILKEERLFLAEKIIAIDQKPCPLEISAIWLDDLKKWKHPSSCQFHYSDYWTESYKSVLRKEVEGNYITDNDFEDSDVTSHIHVTNQCGICVFGETINKVFPIITEEEFWKSISNDITTYDFNDYNPRYFVSNILILGRILSYKKEKRVLSKYDGGQWMLDNLAEEFHYIIENALNVWYDSASLINYKNNDLNKLKHFLIHEISN